MLAVIYAGYVTVRSYLNPNQGPVLPVEMRASSLKEVWIEFFKGLVPPSLLVFAALGSILFGVATPTEAAGCGALGALLLALAYRKLTLAKLQEALIKTLEFLIFLQSKIAFASGFFFAVSINLVIGCFE